MNNKKEYLKPLIKDEEIELEDIIATSGKDPFETDEI
jgi:hypothetical protein